MMPADRDALKVYHNLMDQDGPYESSYKRAAAELRESFTDEMEKELGRRMRLDVCADTLARDIAATDAGLSIEHAAMVVRRLRAWARGETPPRDEKP